MVQQSTQAKFPVRLRDELLNTPDPKFLIDGVIVEKSFVVIFGPPGAGKSFIALDIFPLAGNLF
jgi:predicted ATP-dependent serine protease